MQEIEAYTSIRLDIRNYFGVSPHESSKSFHDNWAVLSSQGRSNHNILNINLYQRKRWSIEGNHEELEIRYDYLRFKKVDDVADDWTPIE